MPATATATKKIRVVVAKPGLDGQDRGAKIIARAARCGHGGTIPADDIPQLKALGAEMPDGSRAVKVHVKLGPM